MHRSGRIRVYRTAAGWVWTCCVHTLRGATVHRCQSWGRTTTQLEATRAALEHGALLHEETP